MNIIDFREQYEKRLNELGFVYYDNTQFSISFVKYRHRKHGIDYESILDITLDDEGRPKRILLMEFPRAGEEPIIYDNTFKSMEELLEFLKG